MLSLLQLGSTPLSKQQTNVITVIKTGKLETDEDSDTPRKRG